MGVVGAEPEEPCVKGAVIREMMIWYVARCGRLEAERVFHAIPPEKARALRRAEPAFGIQANTWYPMSLLGPMLDAVMARSPDEGRELAREANAALVPRLIRGLYRFVFEMAASPERYAQMVPMLWRRLHTTGRRSMVIRSRGEAFSTIEEWPGHHPLLCWTVIYTMAFVFEAMGYRTWEVERVACVAHGGARCETVLRYSR